MASKVTSEGTCQLCGKKFGKGAMANHLRACRKKQSEQAAGSSPRKVRTFQIVVEGSQDHWLHLEAAADATLDDLDALLRRIWLECCGHCSDFKIGDTRYSHAAEMGWAEFNDQPMDARLQDVLRNKLKFSHTYDYGSTTECRLRVAGEDEAALKRGAIEIRARNELPDYRCEECGKPATFVCTECLWDGVGWLCDGCLSEHECGEDLALPVVNSPRMGVCGYTGP